MPITRDDILNRITRLPLGVESLGTAPRDGDDPTAPMPLPDTPAMVPEPQGPSLTDGSGGGFASKHKLLLALLGGLGTIGAGALGPPKFRLGMAQGMQNVGPNIVRALMGRRNEENRKEAQQTALDSRQEGRDTMLARMGLYKGTDPTLKAVSDQAQQDKQDASLKSTPEGVFKRITPEEAQQNAQSDIENWLASNPNATIQEKLAYHNQRSEQLRKEQQLGWGKVAEPAAKEIIPVSGGYLDSDRRFHQTAQEKPEPARKSYMDTEGIRRYEDTGEPVFKNQPTRSEIAGAKKEKDIARLGQEVSKTAQDLLDALDNPSTGKEVEGYMGGPVSFGGFKRLTHTDRGTAGLPEMPQSVVDAQTKADLLLTALTHKQSGAAFSIPEQQLYRLISGGLNVSPATLRTKLKAVINFVDRSKSTVPDNVDDIDKRLEEIRKRREAIQGKAK